MLLTYKERRESEEVQNNNTSDDEAIFGNAGVGAAPQIETLETHVQEATLVPQLFKPSTTL